LADRGPNRIRAGLRVFMVEIAPLYHSPGAQHGLCGKASVPAQPPVFPP
jgi:hypothetical protein